MLRTIIKFSVDYSCLLILSLIFLVVIGCSTTKKEQIISNLPESQMQETGETREDFIAKIALFPFENFSEDIHALEKVMPVVQNQVESKGFKVLDEETLEHFLLKERIRATGYISKEMAKKLGKELDVEGVIVGSINTLNSGRNPKVGFSARFISSSDGSIIWANHESATGEDFTGILGLGTIRETEILVKKIIDNLFDSFSIYKPYKEKESTYMIAVMPFKNKSEIKGAGMIATYMFIVELFKSKIFIPLPYGDVRELVVKLRVRSKGEIDFRNIGSIAESAGVDGILVGTVEHYTDVQGTIPPLALLSARLIDARTGRILWYDGYQYRGDDGVFILDWGRLRSAEDVAYKVVSKLVKNMSKAKWE